MPVRGRLSALLTLILASAALVIVTAATPAVAAPCDPPVVNPVACENTKPGSPESEWGITGAGSPPRSRASPPTSASTRARRSGSRSTPAPRPTGSTSTAWATTAGTAPARSPPSHPTVLNNQPACLTDCRDRSRRLRELDPERVVGRAGDRRVGDLLRQAGAHRRHRRRQPRLLRRARRRRRVRHALPDLGHHVAGLQQLRRQQPLHRRTSRARVQGELQPSVHHARQRARGLGLQRRVPDGALPRVQRLRRQLQLRRRHRPPGRRAARAQGVHVASATTSTGRARSARTSRRPATRASTWRSSAATRSSGRRAGRTASTAPARRTARWCPTRRPTPTPRSTRSPTTWTGTWRDPRFSPPADGGRPENALTGTMFTVNCCAINMVVGQADGQMRFWRNTRVASLGTNATTTIGTNVIGYEWDEDPDNGFRPPARSACPRRRPAPVTACRTTAAATRPGRPRTP